MKTELAKNLIILGGGLLYAFLFYSEKMGINSLIFITMLTALLVVKQPDLMHHKVVRLVLFGTLASALMVVIHNSDLAKTIYSLSFISLIGVIQQRTIRFLWYSFVLGLLSIFSSPMELVKSWRNQSSINWNLFFKWGQILILPMLIVPVFLILYASAVPSFGRFIDRIINGLQSLFEGGTNFLQVIYFVWGVLIVSSFFLVVSIADYFQNLDSRQSFEIKRKKRKLWIPFLTQGLKREFFAAILTICLLNVLLFIVNIFHFSGMWNKEVITGASSFSESIHAATEALCFSIILAIGVLLIFFRRNLNFFPNNKPLLILTYIWIAQNGLLAAITFGHDFLYFYNYGLTYYRLYILLFLFFVVIGLFTAYIKIRYQKSTFFLLTANGWLFYLTFIFLTLFNWDTIITHYNLNHAKKENIDLNFLYNSLSDNNLRYLTYHHQKISQKAEGAYVEKLLNKKIKRFRKDQAKRTWKSWNLSDYRTKKVVEGIR